MKTFTLQAAPRGLATLSKEVRQAHNIRPGQQMTRLDLDAVFGLSLRPSQVDATADRIAGELAGRGEMLEPMLQARHQARLADGHACGRAPAAGRRSGLTGLAPSCYTRTCYLT